MIVRKRLVGFFAAFAWLISVAIIVSACGGDGDQTASGGPSPSEPVVTPSSTATPTTSVSPVATPRPEVIEPQIQEYAVPAGSRPHDVAPAPDGSVWYTAQGSGELGRLDPATGQTHHIDLGSGSARTASSLGRMVRPGSRMAA